MCNLSYDEMLAFLSNNPTYCGTCRGWMPTEFVKMGIYLGLPVVIKFRLDIKLKEVYIPDYRESVTRFWSVHDGGDSFGDINKIGF